MCYAGISFRTVDVDEDIDGLSGIANRDIRFVVVASAVPMDRMRMNLAHEFGHVVIKPTDNVKFDEQVAFRFGAALIDGDE